MYIGSLNGISSITFKHSGTDIPFLPDSAVDGIYTYAWDRVFDSSFDVCYTLDRECYIGSVCFTLSGAQSVMLLADSQQIKVSKNPNGDGINAPVLRYSKQITLRIKGNLQNVTLCDVQILGAYDDSEPLLFPSVKHKSFTGGRVAISSISAASDDPNELFAASFLSDSIAERYGDILVDVGVPVVCKLTKDSSLNGERYTVDIDNSRVTLTASNRLSLLYAADTILRLIEDGRLPTCHIDDTPDVPMRGFHMGLPRRDRIEFTKRLFRYILLPMRYNHVIIEFNGAMRFDRHPEISEKWLEAADRHAKGLQPRITHSDMGADGTLLEKEDVRDLIDYISELGFEVIPEVQSLGHVQYITYAHPELAELEENAKVVTDRRGEDERPDAFYPHSYCPSKKESLDLIHDIIDEIVEVARPKRFVHIGHDEIYQVGLCPICRKKKKSDLYLEHVLDLHGYMAKKGLRIMLWSDMLHENLIGSPNAPHNLSYSRETYTAIERLPRDIVLLDFTWYFNFDRDIEEDLIRYGNEIMLGNLYSSHYPRYASRIAKKGMVGGEVSTWVKVSEEDYADNGKMWDLCYTGEMLWNAKSYNESYRYVYNHIIADRLIPTMRDQVRGKLHTNETVLQLGNLPGAKKSVPAALVNTVPEVVAANGDCLAIGKKLDRLIFDHATLFSAPRIAWQPLYLVGNYVIRYEDGTEYSAPVRYAGNALTWNSIFAEPLPQQYYRHQGYIGTWYSDPTFVDHTTEGENILFTGYSLDNPYPEKVITEISYRPAEDDICTLLIRGIYGITFNK